MQRPQIEYEVWQHEVDGKSFLYHTDTELQGAKDVARNLSITQNVTVEIRMAVTLEFVRTGEVVKSART